MAHDVIVVGSGPSGAMAAQDLVGRGLDVLLLDVGHDDEKYRGLIPDQPFAEIRARHSGQRRFFLGDELEGIPDGEVRVGMQLTPPRQFITRDVAKLLPYRSSTFEPMQSLALGGLGAGWGAAVFTYTDSELRALGVYEGGFREHYDRVARIVGLSGPDTDDTSPFTFCGVADHQPPLPVDENAKSILASYARARASLNARGFYLGRTPLAVLSRDLGSRRANPLHDMDFWGEVARSVYRPRYTIEELMGRPGFTFERNQLVLRFDEQASGVTVTALDVCSDTVGQFKARALMLCAGALSTGRIALRSLGLEGYPTPVLCNPYVYLPCINLPMLGRAWEDQRRHSLSQLCGIHQPPDDPGDVVSLQFYSYGSLLLFKLVKEIPLPPWAGLLVARALCSGLTIVGLHHSDRPSRRNTMRICAGEPHRPPVVEFEYAPDEGTRRLRRQREDDVIRRLRRIGCLALSRIDPGHASSIHYAGTVPITADPEARLRSEACGRLAGSRAVFIGDASSWSFLPSKGLTLTVMANARRVAGHLAASLGLAPQAGTLGGSVPG